ncbi:MAG TPA: RHS repeat-associated core domain-containing protein [Anaerolineae bacterium]|nr:RHS repeat-associated core domain-containing protein [Anaerolineae bacterium]
MSDGTRVNSVLNGVTTCDIGVHFDRRTDGWPSTGIHARRQWQNRGAVLSSDAAIDLHFHSTSIRCGPNGATSTLTYLHADHLGSASLSTNASGGKVSEMRYYPYGETRSGAIATDRRYTGQRQEIGLGLYDYNARSYDPSLGRFIQADTIVPSPANPQSLNRYAYALNNPLRYTDPTGHYSPEEIKKYLQDNYKDWQSYWDAWQADPYWMWILDQAQDKFVLKIAATGKVFQFLHKEGSFTLNEGQLHEYQGAYALYNENMQLVEDKSWLGYQSTSGTFGRMADGKWRRSYFQPMYDYSGGKPVFTQWRYITVSYGKPELRIFGGDNVPYIISGGYGAAVWIGAKFGISLECPPLGVALAGWSLITAIDNLTVNTADRVNYQYVDWTPPPSGPHPASTALQNPNGIGYPAP